jgi:hypothetical protein
VGQAVVIVGPGNYQGAKGAVAFVHPDGMVGVKVPSADMQGAMVIITFDPVRVVAA